MLNNHGYVRVEGDIHPPRIWTALVGRTSKGRKGTAWGRIYELLASGRPGLGEPLHCVGHVVRRGCHPRRARPDRAEDP